MTDEEIKRLAEKFTNGETVEALAVELQMPEATIKRLLKMAKSMFPELNWPGGLLGEYRAPKGTYSQTKYVEMKDGKPGTRGVPQGSIVKARRR